MQSSFRSALATALTTFTALAVASAEDAAAPKQGWESDISFGFNMTKGNQDTLLQNAALNSKYTKDVHELKFAAQNAYGENEVENDDGTTSTETTAQNAGGSAKYSRAFDRVYGFGIGRIDYDKIAEVDYRVFVGPGVGYYLVRNARRSFAVEAGAGYLWEEVADVKDDYPQLTFGERYEQSISETAKIWEAAEFQPRVDDFQDYLLTAEVGVESALTKRLALRLIGQDKYDSTPGEGLERNDLTVTASLAVKF